MAGANETERRRLASELAIQSWAEGGADDPVVRAKLIDSNPHISSELEIAFKRLVLIERAFQGDVEPSTADVQETQSAADPTKDKLPFDWTLKCSACQITLQEIDTLSPSSGDLPTCPRCGRDLIRAQELDANASGDVIDHYRLERVLGTGGFGTVWLAIDEDLQRPVALKIPKRGRLTADEQRTFLREARIAASVRHPMIVTVYDVGVHQDSIYICSEYIDGQTLAHWQSNQEDQPEAACRLILQLCEPLRALHDAGIIHRDLKPGNILIDSEGVGCLTDFGVAKLIDNQTAMTVTGHVLGTPTYMAPEIIAGNSKHADARTDIYSIGVVLYELLSTSVPFKGSLSDLESAIVHDPPPKLESFNTPWKIPADLELVCLKCLEKHPNDRYQSVDQLAADLDRFLGGSPVKAKPKPWPLSIYRRIEKRPALSAAVAIATFSLLMIPYLVGTIHEITQDFRREKNSLQGKNQQLENANDEAELAIAELQTKTEHVARQKAIESLAQQAVAFAETLPQSGLELAIDVAAKVSADDSPYLREDQIQRELATYQMLVDLAVRTVGVRPAMPVGPGTRLQLMDPNRLVIRKRITDPTMPSRFSRHPNRVDECFSVWLPHLILQSPRNQLSKLRELNYRDVQQDDRFLLNSSAIVRFKHKDLSTIQARVPANNDIVDASHHLEKYSLDRPGAMTCYWKGLPAADCVVSNDGRIVVSLNFDGSISVRARIDNSKPTAPYADIKFEDPQSQPVDQIRWMDDADVLLVEADSQVTAWQLDRRPKAWTFHPRAIWNTSLADIVCYRKFVGVHSRSTRTLSIIDTAASESIDRMPEPFLQVPCDEVFDLFVSSSRDKIYVACKSNDRQRWQMWDTQEGGSEEILTWDDNQICPRIIAHPTQDLAVLVGRNLTLLDTLTGHTQTLPSHTDGNLNPSALAWLGTSNKLLIGIGNQVAILNTADPNVSFKLAIPVFHHPATVESLISSPKGDWLASVDTAGDVRIAGFPIRNALQRSLISMGVQNETDAIQRLTPNVAGTRLLCHYKSGLVEVLENKKIGGESSWEKLGSKPLMKDAAIGGRITAFLGRKNQLIAYSDKAFERALLRVQVPNNIHRVTISQDDRWLIAWGNSQVLTYDLSEPNQPPSDYQSEQTIRSLRLSMDHRTVVILESHPQITVLALKTQEVINQYAFAADQPHSFEMPLVIANDYAFVLSGGNIHALATSASDHNELFIGGDKVSRESVRNTSLRVSNWRSPAVSTWVSKEGKGLFLVPRANSLRAFLVGDASWQWKELWRGVDYTQQVRKWRSGQYQQIVACSHDRTWILSASGMDILLWNGKDELQNLPQRVPVDSNDSVTAAAFSSDHRFLAIGFDSGTVRFWPLAVDGLMDNHVVIPISTNRIDKLDFFADSQELIIGSGQEVFRLSLDVAKFARQLQALVSQPERVRSQIIPRLRPTIQKIPE